MKKSTKGALAAAAAGSLLLGGAGSLAYWTDAGTITGGNIKSGHLKLVANPAGCDPWKLGGVAFSTATDRIVPGDSLTRHCEFTADMVGKSLTAKVDVTAPTFAAGGLAGALTPSATYTVGPAGTPGAPVAAGALSTIVNNDVVGVDIVVDFPHVASPNNNLYNSSVVLTGALNNITVTATQQ